MPPKGETTGARALALQQHVFAQDQDKLRGNPAAIMDVIDAYSQAGGRLMTFKPPKLEVASAALSKTKPKNIVELGTFVGFSALAWGKMIKEFHPDTSGCRVVSMELNEDCASVASSLLKLAGLDDIVQVVQGQSGDSLRKLTEYGIDKIDCLFLDHWEEFYLPDLQICEELDLLHAGTVIVADNTDFPGAPDYLEYVRSGGRGRYQYTSTTYPTKSDEGRANVIEVTTLA